MASLALTSTTEQVAFYIIDAGSGEFHDLSRLPHVAGIATRATPEKLRRIVDEVVGFLDTPAGRDVVLVIDGWQALIGPDQEFDDLRTALGRLASDGPAAGIHLVLSVQRWTSLRSSIRDLIGNRLELRLGEALDSQIGRKQQQKLPTDPGRGLDAEGRMMLIAQTSKEDVAHIADEARRAGLQRVPQLRMLPATSRGKRFRTPAAHPSWASEDRTWHHCRWMVNTSSSQARPNPANPQHLPR